MKNKGDYSAVLYPFEDHKLKFNKVWTCIRASEAEENLKDYGRIFEERSTRSQHLRSEERNSEAEDLHQTLKTSTLWRIEDPEGPKIHVRFVLFCSCLYQVLIVQSVFFWPCIETNKKLQGQPEWTDNFNLCNEFRMSNQQYYPYQVMIQHPWFEASQQLLMASTLFQRL